MIMTPQQKADKLCMRFLIQTTTDVPYGINKAIAKECALIAVDEILEDNRISYMILGVGINKYYWEEVKKEIELL